MVYGKNNFPQHDDEDGIKAAWGFLRLNDKQEVAVDG